MSTITHHRMPGTETMPLSSAVQVDNTLYLSGCLGTAPGNPAVVEGGIQPETRQTMENMKAVLEAYGSSDGPGREVHGVSCGHGRVGGNERGLPGILHDAAGAQCGCRCGHGS